MSISSFHIIALKLKFDQIIFECHSIERDLCMMQLGLQAGDMMFYYNSDCTIEPNSITTAYSYDGLSSTTSSSTDSINQFDFDEESINSSILIPSANSSVFSYPSWTSSMDTLISGNYSIASSYDLIAELEERARTLDYYYLPRS